MRNGANSQEEKHKWQYTHEKMLNLSKKKKSKEIPEMPIQTIVIISFHPSDWHRLKKNNHTNIGVGIGGTWLGITI